MEILIKKLHAEAKLPAYTRETGPGMDLYALEETTIEPEQEITLATGLAVAIPIGYFGLIWDKHSTVATSTIRVLAEIIDSGYREEIKVTLRNLGPEPKTYTAGQKIAQMLIQKVELPRLIEAEELSETRPLSD